MPDAELLARPDPFGWYPLRAAISEHLLAWRGLTCDPAQIIITGGAWDAFDIIFQSMFKSGQHVAIEDPDGRCCVRHLIVLNHANTNSY